MWAVQNYEVREKYEAVPISEMPCFTNKITKNNLNFDENEMQTFFISQLPESAIAQHHMGRSSGQMTLIKNVDFVEEQNFYTLILNNAAQSIIMLEIHSLSLDIPDCCASLLENEFNQNPENIIQEVQKSKMWRTVRQYRVTGSRCYELYTYSKNDWETKSMKYFWPKSFTNKYVKHGEKFERFAREAFLSITGFKIIECGLVIPHNNKWLGFSPDGVIFENGHPTALLEIKCVFEGSKMTICDALQTVSYLKRNNGEYLLKSKHKYYGQIQLGLSILNLTKCYLILYASFDDSFVTVEVDFDYNFSSKMLSHIKFNYMKNMIHNICTFRKN